MLPLRRPLPSALLLVRPFITRRQSRLTWKAKFEAEAGWQLRPSYLASFPTLSALGAGAGADGDGRGRADNDPTGSIPPAASPSKLLSALSLESPRRPTAANDAANSLLAPSYKTLYAKRLWLARRFGHNNEFYDPSSSAESLVGGDQVVVERELSGHTDSIYALAFDGHKVITGSRDRSIKVWDVASGQLLQTVDEAHRASVLCVAFEEVGPGKRGEGAMAVSGGSDGVVTLWDLGGACRQSWLIAPDTLHSSFRQLNASISITLSFRRIVIGGASRSGVTVSADDQDRRAYRAHSGRS